MNTQFFITEPNNKNNQEKDSEFKFKTISMSPDSIRRWKWNVFIKDLMYLW